MMFEEYPVKRSTNQKGYQAKRSPGQSKRSTDYTWAMFFVTRQDRERLETLAKLKALTSFLNHTRRQSARCVSGLSCLVARSLHFRFFLI